MAGARLYQLFPEPDPRSRRMPSYRVTFRYGAPRALYEILDVEADDLRGAMRLAAERVREPVAATAELVEIRVQRETEEREYTEG